MLALAHLAEDLRSGQWDAQFGWVRQQTSLDLGYRLIIAPCSTPHDL